MILLCNGNFTQTTSPSGWRPRCDVQWTVKEEPSFLGLPSITQAEAHEFVTAFMVLFIGAWVWRKLRHLF